MMNIIKAGGLYKVYGEEIDSFDRLPVKTFRIIFNKMQGYSLMARNNLEITEEKIYGNNLYKAGKVMKSYYALNRNFGVLLSGPKGIGKSLFLRILAKEAIDKGLPVIIVDAAYPGISSFISSIDQDCMVVFDEFEKIFTISEDNENLQDELLGLFDGIDGGHKLFVVTCNDLSRVSKYMINRPGRFHYHFTMTPPTPDEVKEYMSDKLLPEYHDQIPKITAFSSIIDMPYDYLRAIAFELNQGYSLKETLGDLNITKEDWNTFDLEMHLSNGMIYDAFNICLDLSINEYSDIRFRNYTKDNTPDTIWFHFLAKNAKVVNKEFIIEEKDIICPDWKTVSFSEDDEIDSQMVEKWTNDNVHPVKLVLKKIVKSGSNRYEI